MGPHHVSGWALSAWKMAKVALLPSIQENKQPDLKPFCSLFGFAWKRRGRVWEEKSEKRGTWRLASHGEFFIGAGNVVLITAALAGVGTSVVLSNRAWPGQRGEESKLHRHHALKGPRVQYGVSKRRGSWEHLWPQNIFEVVALCCPQWIRQPACY